MTPRPLFQAGRLDHYEMFEGKRIDCIAFKICFGVELNQLKRKVTLENDLGLRENSQIFASNFSFSNQVLEEVLRCSFCSAFKQKSMQHFLSVELCYLFCFKVDVDLVPLSSS